MKSKIIFPFLLSGMSIASSSSSFPIPESFTYDVFLSFRGIDTGTSFTDHLYHALLQSGIHTFRDINELRAGGGIPQQLMTAIDESRIAIVVFSKNYASSRWCLEELVRINCRETTGTRVLPVFYDVDPSEVRWQRGSFATAFQRHEARYELNKVEEWRAALTYTADLSGFCLPENFDGHDSRLISQIVKEVLSQVKPKTLFVAKNPVGLDSRLSNVYSLLRLELNDVLLIGIYGMGGKGKTVIAKALYNKVLPFFNSRCFLANVREVSAQQNGLVYLQEQLLSEVLGKKNVKVGNVHRGIRMITERLSRKKVFVVIDDVDKLSQVDSLAGVRNWFGPGTRIIITTRDDHLLNQVQVDERYEAKELNYAESLELFSRHSFNERFPPEPYAVLADKIIAYSGGLALALEVLGSYLFGRSITEWNSAYEKLRQIPREEIQEQLKISYDGLGDDEEREIFLDIACFFIGMDKEYVTEILNGCGFKAEIGIRVLKDRCLLLPDNRKNELRMHDLLRDMGREIIRQTSPKEPRKRSRLWFHKDVTDVLRVNKGTGAVEGITLVSPSGEEIYFSTKSFAGMHNLRLLQMGNVHLDGSFEHLSEAIRWICWENFPLKYLPSDLHSINLVALDMQHSKMIRVWQGVQFLGNLKILNLSHSKCLRSTPDFTRVPRLVTLILEGCESLLAIHPSIGCLASLLLLNLKGCEKITNIPNEICNLRLLEYLNLNGCSNLQSLPENLGKIDFLRELCADETAINKLPSSLVLLKNLRSLSLSGCNKNSGVTIFSYLIRWVYPHRSDAIRFLPPSISGLSALRRLFLRDCNLSGEDIPVDVGSLSELQVLDLAGNSLGSLPSSFTQLTNLESLWLDDWSIVQSLPDLPSNLESLLVNNLSATTRNLPNDQKSRSFID